MKTTSPDETIETSLLMGERILAAQGNPWVARKWFGVAHREARRRGDAEAAARAALGLGGLWVHEHRTVAGAAWVRVRQRDALRGLDPRSPAALRLRVRLAAEDDYQDGRHDRVLALVAAARAAGPPALTEALSLAHQCAMGPGDTALRLELARELIDEATQTGRRSDLLMGLLLHSADLFLAADPLAERRLGELRGVPGRDGHLAVSIVLDAMGVMLAVRGGGLARAETLAAACAERAAAVGDVNAAGWYGGQLATIRWFQGRVAELVPVLTELVRLPMFSVTDHAHLAGLAVATAAAGDRCAAEGMLARLRTPGLAALPESASWLLTMYAFVEAAHLLDDADAAAEAYALLAPYAGLPVMAGLAITCFGSAHHPLGMAALTTGDLDGAVRHLRQALQRNLALGHRPAAVLSRARLGQALALRDGPRDAAARRHLAAAAQEAAALGMTLPAGARSDGAAERVTCRRHGHGWQLALGGRTALVRHSVGMAHLAVLLANPGRDIPAVDLAAGAGTPEPAAAGGAVSAQPVLDEEAGRRYRRRLSELKAELDELEADGRAGDAARVRAERDWLIAELSAAAGLGGRTRRFADNGERARIAVGKAIRRALDRIAAVDTVIGGELRAAVRTGFHCCYRPE
ncbi:hypothetical protein [Actinomadura macrotermitis]|uniref:hypothetical protein n=1 Tax=Actinomadura macrotermitis TaxID=2585200 RepID=UPI002E26CE56